MLLGLMELHIYGKGKVTSTSGVLKNVDIKSNELDITFLGVSFVKDIHNQNNGYPMLTWEVSN